MEWSCALDLPVFFFVQVGASRGGHILIWPHFSFLFFSLFFFLRRRWTKKRKRKKRRRKRGSPENGRGPRLETSRQTKCSGTTKLPSSRCCLLQHLLCVCARVSLISLFHSGNTPPTLKHWLPLTPNNLLLCLRFFFRRCCVRFFSLLIESASMVDNVEITPLTDFEPLLSWKVFDSLFKKHFLFHLLYRRGDSPGARLWLCLRDRVPFTASGRVPLPSAYGPLWPVPTKRTHSIYQVRLKNLFFIHLPRLLPTATTTTTTYQRLIRHNKSVKGSGEGKR